MTTCLGTLLLFASWLPAQEPVGGEPYVALETRAATLERMRALLLPSEAEWGTWYRLGPFPFEGFDLGALAVPLAPERELERMAANGPGPDLAATYAGKDGSPAGWVEIGAGTDRLIDLAGHEDDALDTWSTAYLYASVKSEGGGAVEVRMGSDDGLRYWLNGELVVDADVPRGLDPAAHTVELALEPGVNHVLAKISQGVGDWAFQLDTGEALDPVADARLQYFLDRDFPPSRERASYEVVTVPVPEDVVLEVGGLDVLPDGRPVVATRRGDVYLVDGAYATPPEAARFERFASGLHEPLGAELAPDPEGGLAVLAVQRGELTRLVDEDGDQRADLFATVSDGWGVSGNYHEFAFGPKLDREGNAWVTLCVGFCGSLGKSTAPYRGWALKVTPEGELVPVCDGLRSPNGIGFNAEGVPFYLDNQGDYVATNKLAELVPGAWHGHPASLRWRADFDPDRRPPRRAPAVWFPYRKMGQSTADLALDESGGAFGPFAEQLFVGDQTLATVMRVSLEEVEGHWQGACYPFLEGLDCGVNRLAFAPDGSLFVGETDRGWGSVGRKPYGLQRVRWTGVTPFEIRTMSARADGFELELTADVDAGTATDPGAYALESYTYEHHAEYGAPEIRTERLAIRSAELVGPRRVRLVVDGLRAGYVHELSAAGLRSAAGESLVHPDAYYTLIRIPGQAPVAADERAGEGELPRVLFLTHSAGWVHDVVKRPRPEIFAPAEERLIEAARGRLDVLATQDCARLAELDDFDAVVFYTTGELPVEPAVRDRLVDWVRRGGAFVGVHCATDTFYEYPPYQAMLGGVFDGHPWHEEVGVNVVDAAHPATSFLGERFELEDEIYQFEDFAGEPLRVLLRLDPSSVEIEKGAHPETGYPTAWCRDFGEGRVFYTALGHGEGTWHDERFQEHLLRGIEWAVGTEDLPRPVPDDPRAVSLLAGSDAAGWTHRGGGAARWRPVGGALEVVAGTGDLVSREELGDARIHVEFLVPESAPGAEGQERGNSGVYLQGRYELQVLDSYGLEPGAGDCGALYGIAAPETDATRPAGRWQSFDVRFRAPRFDASGAKTANARVTAWLNGVPIHRDVELPGPTAGGLAGDEVARGPLLLQDHGQPVRYGSIWAVPLD